MAYLYRSRDFLNWTKVEQPLHSVSNTGMWECPDFYPVSHFGRFGLDKSVMGNWFKHVLKVSLEMTRYEYYTLGKYYPMTDKYVPDNTSTDGWSGLRYDYDNFYASKSFYDPMKKRRVLWGWTNESDSVQDDVSKGWAGIQAIPRTVWLDPNGKQLLQWPVMELNRLRQKIVMMLNQKLVKGQNVEIKGITAAQADVEVIFSFSNLDNAEAFDPSWVDAQAVCSITVGLRSAITKNFASGIGITLCSKRNSIPSTTLKLSMRTTTRSNSPVQAPNLKGTLLETPTIDKASELKTFIFPGFFSMVSPNLRAS
ncbi:beta-fructofuranosidase, insoluble isoenzyme 1-like [Cucurbita maxima]|uniref:Beta-fructofuranosidase, insoluble isoenzyme 1-like n=1 Tax=Cucurbita maxima TaxID=3661 RepID=A0A6J1KUR9_CUCMA|nr:beta-fructofuranosidase, insoluble isoenzyme 1-like [Cucurbita maxima]